MSLLAAILIPGMAGFAATFAMMRRARSSPEREVDAMAVGIVVGFLVALALQAAMRVFPA